MTDINRVGIDLAKTVFHVTAVDEAGAVVERKPLSPGGATLLPDPAIAGLLGGNGSLWQCSSLGTAGVTPGSQGLDDEPTQGGAVHQRQQERRQ